MSEAERVRELVFDIAAMDRPHRSGILAVVIAYAALFAYGSVNQYHGEGPFSIVCAMFPWECPNPDEADDHPENVTLLYSRFGNLDEENVCITQWEFRLSGKVTPFEMTARCNSIPAMQRTWGNVWNEAHSYTKALDLGGNVVATFNDGDAFRFVGWHEPRELARRKL